MAADREEAMHVLHVGFQLDPLQRAPEELLAAWPTLADVARAASGSGVRVTVVQAAHRDAIIERDGIVYHFVAGDLRATRRAPSWPRAHARRARSLRPDLVHVQGLSFPLQTRSLARALPGVPILVQDHADRPPPRWKRPLHRWGLAPIAGAAFTTRCQAAPFVEAGVLRRGLPVFEVLESSSRFTPGDATEARRRTGLVGDPCLLWLGRLDGNKDPLTVLAAFDRALDALPDARLWCCYTGAPLLEMVRARLAADARLGERVRLLGAVPHATIQKLLRAADFLVLGSHREGSGYAVIEALACGTTPLVTDIPSFRRITEGGAFGALSPPGDAETMARALVEWAARDRVALRRAARAHFERALSFDAMGAELRAAYRALVDHRRGAPALA